MRTRTIILIAAASLLAIALLWLGYSILIARPATMDGSVASENASSSDFVALPISATVPTQDRIAIPTKNGSIEVRNFLANSDAVDTTYIVAADERYSIVFQRQLGKFLIALNADSRDEIPVLLSRVQEALARQLGLSSSSLCQLRTDISVPVSYSAAYSDASFENLAFPGCASGAVR